MIVARKSAFVMGIAGALALALSSSAAVFAERGGAPDERACAGQAMALLARSGETPGSLRLTMSDILISSYVRERCAAGDSPESVVQKVREAAGVAP